MKAAALLVLALPSLAWAALDGEGVNKSVLAVRAARPPVIDGRLDDAVWATAPADDRFTQITPREGSPPSERTELRVLFDDGHVYFAVRCFDREPDKIASRLTRRDRDIEADWLAITIDSRHDHNSARFFQLSPAGVQVDGEMFNDNQLTYDWDGVWRGAVSTDDGGWSAEWAIPFSMLRFSDLPQQVWGLQIHRNISRRQEQMTWTFKPSRVQGDISRFGHLVGISGIRPARTFELRPYVVGRVRGRGTDGAMPLDGDVASSADLGVDAKIGLTSGLTLDATVNPDFGQVEADQVVLNLTNFETFFPEKRPFFLEGREIFETPLTLFYPRRIGRPPVGMGIGGRVTNGGGEQLEVVDVRGTLPIWGAAKITGKIGERLGLGVMAALTGAETVDAVDRDGIERHLELAPKRSYAVVRAKLNLTSSAYLGAVATAVNRLGDDIYRAIVNHDAYTQALDGWWQSPNGSWRVQGQVALSQRSGGTSHRRPDGRPCPEGEAEPSCVPITRPDGTPLVPGDVGVGTFARAAFSSESFMLETTYRGLSPQLDLNAMGFLPQFNTHELTLFTGLMKRRPHAIFNRSALFPIAEGALSWDGKVVQRAVVGLDSEATFKNFWYTSPQVFFGLPRTYNDFETFDGAHFERPANVEFNWGTNTNRSKALFFYLRPIARMDLEGDGYGVSLESSVTWQAASNFELALEPALGSDQNAIRFYDCSTASGAACAVESGARHYLFADLDSTYFSLVFRSTYTFIPTLSLQAYAQLFMAEGTFSSFRETDTMGGSPFIRRDDLSPSAVQMEDGFETTSLNLNVVLRWEPLPGSTVFAVYTRAQAAPRHGLSHLDSGVNEDVFLLKLVYFAS